MSFLERKDLYRIEIIERCYCVFMCGVGMPMPSLESVKKNGNWGSIPSGTKG